MITTSTKLTSRGQKLMEEVFRDVKLMEYRINITHGDSFHGITVSRMTLTNEYTDIIPVEEMMGLQFGTCTCGKSKTDKVPCRHVVVIVYNCNELPVSSLRAPIMVDDSKDSFQ